MIIAEYNVLGSFYIYNEEYFGGILPIPFIKIRHSWSTLGYFHCNPDMPEGTSETIEISDFYDRHFLYFLKALSGVPSKLLCTIVSKISLL